MTATLDSIVVEVYPCLNEKFTFFCPLDDVRQCIQDGSIFDIWDALQTMNVECTEQTQREILAYNLIMATLKFYMYLDSGPEEPEW